MRIVVSDYSGHPFQVQLSRQLAARGHTVLHLSSASFQTPKGNLTDDLAARNLRLETVTTDQPFAKHSLIKRRRQEVEIGRKIGAKIANFAPDAVISSNAPLDTQRYIMRATKASGAKFVFWVQDIYSVAISRIVGERLGPIGALVGAYYKSLESQMLRASDHCVVIAQDFVPIVSRMGRLDQAQVSVIENWAPLQEIPTLPRDNSVAERLLPASQFRMIYSGTLGFKHNPALLATLAREIAGDVVVFSEGPAADALRQTAETEGLRNLHVSGWLPFSDLPAALAGADALIVILEPDAGVFSVPSKVLTYMCVGRPILAAMPTANLAARQIVSLSAGLVVDADDDAGLVCAARTMAEDPAARAKMGAAARSHAEHAFAIDGIADRFEVILDRINANKGQ